jgi:prepilin-type N-terminal cleavage/methylation domain-containing protein
MKNNQKGFSFIEVLLVLVVIVFIIGAGITIAKVISHKSHQQNGSTSSSQTVGDSAIIANSCKNNQNALFTHDFTESDKLKLIEPPVITPTNIRDRAWPAIDISKTSKVAIYAPADVTLTSGIFKIAHIGASTYDYDLWFQLSCNRWFFINHITDPDSKIRKLFPDKPIDTANNGTSATADRTSINPLVSFKSGEILGYTSGTENAHNFDLGVFDLNHTNTLPSSFPEPSNSREYHFICPFDLFPDSIKSQYYAILKNSPVEAGSVCPQ